MVFKSKNSAFHWFSTGNKQTLKTDPAKNGVDVHEKLVAFHDRWYRPPNMRLCVLGTEELDELEEKVRSIFKE